jgi:T-complex protein 1 subunit eta
LIREQRALLEKCAQTTLSSKLIARQREFFAKMVVDVVLMLDELLPLNMYVQFELFQKTKYFYV